MSQQPDPLFDRDEQERSHERAEATNDNSTEWLIAALFYRARITYLDIEQDGGGWKVTVPPQRGIVGRTEKLNAEMTDARFSVSHGQDGHQEYYWLKRLI